MKKPRHLSKEERALWEKVAKTAKPMDPVTNGKTVQVAPPLNVAKPPKEPIKSFDIGSSAKTVRHNDVLPDLADRLRTAPLNMDAKSFGRMKRGKLAPEARIDLHGMTLAEAHSALIDFILGAHSDNKRLVLVITGKGRKRDSYDIGSTGIGKIRQQVPQWLTLQPLRNAVLQVTPAHIRHGGEGAYYIYLRRNQ